MDIYLKSRPRVKDWFPELPGLNRLNKSEVINDLETVQSQLAHIAADEEANPHKRKLSVMAGSQEAQANTANKRARLLAKFELELKGFNADKANMRRIREQVDHLRSESASLRQGLPQAKRELANAESDVRALGESFQASFDLAKLSRVPPINAHSSRLLAVLFSFSSCCTCCNCSTTGFGKLGQLCRINTPACETQQATMSQYNSLNERRVEAEQQVRELQEKVKEQLQRNAQEDQKLEELFNTQVQFPIVALFGCAVSNLSLS